MNIPNMNLLHSYMEKVHGHLAFLCVCTVYLSFSASGIKLCTPGCPAVLAWLHLEVRSKRANPRATVFHKDETTTHLPHDMQQSICYNHIQSRKQLLAVWMANTRTSTVDGDMEQHFRASGPRTMHHMCSYACAKGFQLWTLTFQKCTVCMTQYFP